MPLALFQISCVLTLVVAYALEIRRAPAPRRRLATVVALVVAAWAGEHSCIAIHRFYAYADGWWLRVGHVPLLIPLIWPLVVLSADTIVRHFFPALGRWSRAIAVGLVVVFDASLMEVVAVAAGYWTWVEGGYLGVPLMGIAGWGCFAFAARAWLDDEPTPRQQLLLPLVAPLAAHGGIVALWWLAFKWGPRADVPVRAAMLGFAMLTIVYAGAILRARREQPALPRDVIVARLVATAVFVALLVALAEPTLAAHMALVAIPYLMMMPVPFTNPVAARER